MEATGHLVSGDSTGDIKLWESHQGEMEFSECVLKRHEAPIQALSATDKLVSGDSAGFVCVWELLDTAGILYGDCVMALDTRAHHITGLTCLVQFPDSRIASAGNDMVCIWGTDGTHQQSLVGHSDQVRAIARGQDNRLFTGGSDRQLRIWM
eukprot:TRINITY_DN5276_c0_g1_i11.p1 TRINITY_DN5276_c0_g1~~TRINITY_DN5276_c0_g1_i11.p1  ORF type:complete len:152 (-),score=23.58 TRINITY_DN5276_c0_g1_i11:285-740(-)